MAIQLSTMDGKLLVFVAWLSLLSSPAYSYQLSDISSYLDHGRQGEEQLKEKQLPKPIETPSILNGISELNNECRNQTDQFEPFVEFLDDGTKRTCMCLRKERVWALVCTFGDENVPPRETGDDSVKEDSIDVTDDSTDITDDSTNITDDSTHITDGSTDITGDWTDITDDWTDITEEPTKQRDSEKTEDIPSEYIDSVTDDDHLPHNVERYTEPKVIPGYDNEKCLCACEG